jgi:hypothetical protein
MHSLRRSPMVGRAASSPRKAEERACLASTAEQGTAAATSRRAGGRAQGRRPVPRRLRGDGIAIKSSQQQETDTFKARSHSCEVGSLRPWLRTLLFCLFLPTEYPCVLCDANTPSPTSLLCSICKCPRIIAACLSNNFRETTSALRQKSPACGDSPTPTLLTVVLPSNLRQ